MPAPTSGTTLQRPDLASLAWEYNLNAPLQGFIGTEILPFFPVSEEAGDYPMIPIEAILKLEDTSRRVRGAYQRGDYEFETDTYKCKENGWEEPLDDVERKLYQRYFDAEEVATKRAMDKVLRNQEKRISAYLFNTSNITNTGAVTTEWDTAATCTPRADVMSAKSTLRAATGIQVDSMALSLVNFESVLASSEFLSAFQYTTPIQSMPMDAQRRVVAQYFMVDNIFIGGAMYDSAKKGQSYSLSDIWDDEYCLLFKRSSGLDLMDPALGRTFLWTQDSPDNTVVEEYREENIRSDIYRVRQYTDEELIFAGAGYLLSNIHT